MREKRRRNGIGGRRPELEKAAGAAGEQPELEKAAGAAGEQPEQKQPGEQGEGKTDDISSQREIRVLSPENPGVNFS